MNPAIIILAIVRRAFGWKGVAILYGSAAAIVLGVVVAVQTGLIR